MVMLSRIERIDPRTLPVKRYGQQSYNDAHNLFSKKKQNFGNILAKSIKKLDAQESSAAYRLDIDGLPKL